MRFWRVPLYKQTRGVGLVRYRNLTSSWIEGPQFVRSRSNLTVKSPSGKLFLLRQTDEVESYNPNKSDVI